MILEIFSQHADRLVQTGLHFLWQGTAIVLLAWLACRLVFRKPSQRSFIYFMALAAMPVVVALTFQSLEKPPGTVLGPASNIVQTPSESIAGLKSIDSKTAPLIGQLDETSSTSYWIVGAYFLGLLFMMGRVIFGYRWSQKVRREGQAVQEGNWPQALATAVEVMKVRTQPLMMWSQNVSTPVVTGLIRPMVVLPASLMSGLSMPQTVAVLSHELAHLKRFDHVIVLLQRLLESFFFFHPAVWLLSRGLDREREKACDDLVVSAGTNPADYAEALLVCANEQSEPLALAAAKETQIKERVLRILNYQGRATVQLTRGGWLVVAATIIALGFVSLTPAQSQEKKIEEKEEKGIATIQQKLQIKIPVLDFTDATLEEGIEFLRRRSIELDPSPDPTKKGLNFVAKKSAMRNDQGLVVIDSLFARDFTIEDALKAICQKTNSSYKIDQFAVIIVSNEDLEKGDAQLLTRLWKTPEAFLDYLTPKAAAGRKIPVQELLELVGVAFPEGASAKFISASNSLVLRNTPENLDLVDVLVKGSIDPDKTPEKEVAPIDEEKAEIQKIIIPAINFQGATLKEAVDFLRQRALDLDPAKKGVNINIFGGKTKISKNMIPGLNLNNVPLPDALQYVCSLTKTRFVRDGRNISIFPIEE